MTHSLIMTIEFDTYEDVLDFRKHFAVAQMNSQSPMYWYRVIKGDEYTFAGRGNICPFIYFPSKDMKDGEKYRLSIETGSHCGWEDFHEALFVWLYWSALIDELLPYVDPNFVWIHSDGSNEKLTLEEAFDKILEAKEV